MNIFQYSEPVAYMFIGLKRRIVMYYYNGGIIIWGHLKFLQVASSFDLSKDEASITFIITKIFDQRKSNTEVYYE